MAFTINQNLIPGLPQEAYDGGVGAYLGVIGHATDNMGDTANNERSYEARTFNDAFVHFFVDDTQILQVADINYLCYGAGHTANHAGYVQIELCESSDPAKFAAAYSKYVWLLAKILFDKKLSVIDGKTLMSHAQVSQLIGGTDHMDPLSYLASHGMSWTNVVADVTAQYNAMANGQDPSPIIPNPSSTPTTRDLGLGDNGDDVKLLQQNLIKLNYLAAGSDDGDFGPITQTAVKKFQGDNGLTADGVVGPMTRAKIAEKITASSGLQQGSSGAEVTTLQQQLIKLGYLPAGSDDGDFGPLTKAAVVKFQSDNGLSADGIVGPMTKAKIKEKIDALNNPSVMYRVFLDGVKIEALSVYNNAVNEVKTAVDTGKAKSGKVQRNTDSVDLFVYPAPAPAPSIDYETQLCRIIVDGVNKIALTGKTKCITYANATFIGHIIIQCVSDSVVVADYVIAAPTPIPTPVPTPVPVLVVPVYNTTHAIMGQAECTADQMYEYLLKHNPTPKLTDSAYNLVQSFLAEGASEGVRGDIAFAQSIHETGFFGFGGDVKPEQNNFAGIGATGGGAGGATFPDIATGIRAQIQHLKAYASTEALKLACVDPRYSLVTKGVAPNLEDLAGKWAVPGFDKTKFSDIGAAAAAGQTYGQLIANILDSIKAVVIVPEPVPTPEPTPIPEPDPVPQPEPQPEPVPDPTPIPAPVENESKSGILEMILKIIVYIINKILNK
jgi:peptidoglycan hydrolase-like protein with peptidoglycan-binding domain